MKRLNNKDNLIVSVIVYAVIGLIFLYGYVYLIAYLFTKDPKKHTCIHFTWAVQLHWILRLFL